MNPSLVEKLNTYLYNMHKHLCRLRDCPKVIHRCFFVFRKNTKKIFGDLNPEIGG